jgi:hypothetical protein
MITRRRVTLELLGPVLTRSTAIGAFGLDAPAARLPDGTLYIPGSLVIGRLRDAFRGFAKIDQRYANALDTWFGQDEDKETGLPRRRRVFIGDLKFVTLGRDATRPRVAIDPISESVLEGALQVLEAPFAIRESAVCTGEIRLLGRPDEIPAFWPLLEKALQWITQLGGLRTVGYGSVQRACLGTDIQPTVRPAPAIADRLQLVLDVCDPLCVGETRNDPNTYTSSDVVPGGAIKGTLASLILADRSAGPETAVEEADTSALGNNFSRLRFTHAFPVSRPAAGNPTLSRPSRIPWSWASAPEISRQGDALKNEVLYDAARAANPAAAYLVAGKAPKFSPDWKGQIWAKAANRVGWSSPETDLRIRTAIDERFRSAKANRLFAIECRVTSDHLWVGEVDLADVPAEERAAVVQELDRHLKHGLVGLGRVGSDARVHLMSAAVIQAPETDEDGRVTLVLQSSALLRDPAALGDVTDAYRTSFAQLAPGCGLQLGAIFVRERLSGADFMATRFFDKRRPYRPYLLTDAGSTFVFHVDPGLRKTALEMVADWERRGLDIPAATLAAYDLQNVDPLWRVCPFVRQNGYGEVASRTRLAENADPPRPLHGFGIEELPPEIAAKGEPP